MEPVRLAADLSRLGLLFIKTLAEDRPHSFNISTVNLVKSHQQGLRLLVGLGMSSMIAHNHVMT